MEPVRKALGIIKRYLGQLTVTQKLLVGALAVILAMTLFLVSQYAGRADMVDLMAADGQEDVVNFLRANHIPAKLEDGRVMVPPGTRNLALASMAEAGKLPDDTAVLFNSLIDRQKWTNSREQNEQLYTIALQNELSRIVSTFKSVRSASVILDVPRPVGIGAATREPTASATLFMRNGQPLTQGTVDAVAALVSSARAGLDIRNVRVIDGTHGRQFSASSADEFAATTYLEHQTAVENKMRAKLLELLSYIPGVIVAVTADVDVARENSQTTLYRSADEGGTVSLLGHETSRSQTQKPAVRGAESGLRSNVGADINRGSGGGSTFESNETETTMDNRVGSVVTERTDPKGMATRLGVSVNVPRSYIVQAIKAGNPDAGDPTEEDVLRKFDEIKAEINKSVIPHVKTERSEGEVNVGLIPIDTGPVGGGVDGASAGLLGGLASGGGLLGLGGGIVDKAMLVLLAVVSLGLMFTMVRRAGKEAKLPTADELVGIPPPLETRSDVIGEANETDAPMTGIEVGEGDMAREKMLLQVQEMVKQNPEGASRLVNRWISSEE